VIAWRLEQYEELGSTSDFCIGRAKEGEAEGLAITAARQTAGRGSRGRNWLSSPGNLALSVLLRPNIKPSDSSIFPLLTGIAVAEAVQNFCPPGMAPMLKWPNDVLINNAKIAGLLIDAAPIDGRMDWLVIGIGINLAFAPDLPGRVTTSLATHGVTVAPQTAAETVLGRLSTWLATFNAQGPAAIIAAWLQRAHPIGAEIEVHGLTQTTAGTFAGLSPTGELLLNVENRIETFRTGEILLGTRT
jgi:BirA family biotin operon repressor/biotin-[acetyl-CoA-carboxylase] ligase